MKKLVTVRSGAGNNHIGCSKSRRELPGHVITVGNRTQWSPSELSNKISENK